MKGLLILSEARCGSTWLASLTNSTGRLGNADEWLKDELLQPQSSMTGEEHYQAIIGKSATDNGAFAVKIFPHHLRDVYEGRGYDFIRRCMLDHEVVVVLLERMDRLGAAISATRASQTGQWSSKAPGMGTGETQPRYDSERIRENMLYIGEGLSFWRNYLTLRSIPYLPLFYEHAMSEWHGYVMDVSGRMGIAVDREQASNDTYEIQRDALSEQWRRKFQEESESRPLEGLYAYGHVYPRTVSNLVRFLLKRDLRARIRFDDHA